MGDTKGGLNAKSDLFKISFGWIRENNTTGSLCCTIWSTEHTSFNHIVEQYLVSIDTCEGFQECTHRRSCVVRTIDTL